MEIKRKRTAGGSEGGISSPASAVAQTAGASGAAPGCSNYFRSLRLAAAAARTPTPMRPEMIVIGSGTSLGRTGGQWHGGEVGSGISLGITTGGGTGGTITTGGGEIGITGEIGETFTSSEPTGTGGKKAKAPDESTVNAAQPNAAAGTFFKKRTTMMTTSGEIHFRTVAIDRPQGQIE